MHPTNSQAMLMQQLPPQSNMKAANKDITPNNSACKTIYTTINTNATAPSQSNIEAANEKNTPNSSICEAICVTDPADFYGSYDNTALWTSHKLTSNLDAAAFQSNVKAHAKSDADNLTICTTNVIPL
mmetsp:Transcript_43459/g.52683  ORF Transcript_43459/g.52683 Transcript_43459/m.52683 type:complete len:128 (-) Transcript_43459:457-840(-)